MSKENDIESLQAKIVVLGDIRTGKSSLIRSLDPYSKNINQANSNGDQTSFTVIEIPSNELDTVANIFLKFWEYTGGSKEQEIAFPGALFCIITLDMRAPETANSAFNKWMNIKESQMSESFLIVVGTFLDFATQRRVEISEICKACAQKEAIYIEVSNLDGSNINLLRRLICQRLNQMLKIREEQKHAASLLGRSLTSNESKNISSDPNNPSFSEESKSLPSTDLIIDSISPALLEKNILSHNIGGVYTSTFYATSSDNEWIGFDRESQNLMHVGKRITNYIDSICVGLQIPSLPPEDYHPLSSSPSTTSSSTIHKNSNGQSNNHGLKTTTLTEPDADEVRHLFELMGLPLPQTLQQHQNGNKSQKRATVKMKIRLPDGNQTNLILRSGDNIEEIIYQFLVNHDMEKGNSMNRLIDVGTAMLRRAEEQETTSNYNERDFEREHYQNDNIHEQDYNDINHNQYDDSTTQMTNFSLRTIQTNDRNNEKSIERNQNKNPKVKKCKARIKLPNNQIIETIVTQGENAMTIAKRLADEYGLSMGYQHKMWEQLQFALDSLDRNQNSNNSQSSPLKTGPNSKII